MQHRHQCAQAAELEPTRPARGRPVATLVRWQPTSQARARLPVRAALLAHMLVKWAHRPVRVAPQVTFPTP